MDGHPRSRHACQLSRSTETRNLKRKGNRCTNCIHKKMHRSAIQNVNRKLEETIKGLGTRTC
uniref:Uncharacterized protein n=1 Tax=Arundo donax TaxID=35708 RepID=A0A0A9D6C6_ARUDO